MSNTKTRWTREFNLQALARMEAAADVTTLAAELGCCRELLYEPTEGLAISIVTWMEVTVGASAQAERATGDFLDAFTVIALNEKIAKQAVVLRKSHRLKLPDAIVWASAWV